MVIEMCSLCAEEWFDEVRTLRKEKAKEEQGRRKICFSKVTPFTAKPPPTVLEHGIKFPHNHSQALSWSTAGTLCLRFPYCDRYIHGFSSNEKDSMDVKLEARKNTLSEVTHDTPAVSTQTRHAAQDIAFGSVSDESEL